MEIRETRLKVTKEYVAMLFKDLVSTKLRILNILTVLSIVCVLGIMQFAYSMRHSIPCLVISFVLIIGIAIFYDHSSTDRYMLAFYKNISDETLYRELINHIDVLGSNVKSFKHKKLLLIAYCMNKEGSLELFNDSFMILNGKVIIELSKEFYSENTRVIFEQGEDILLEVTDDWIRLLEN